MVTCTLKLGISILNGGNVQVQQVWFQDCILVFFCLSNAACIDFFNQILSSCLRKCLIIWKRKEMQAFSRASQDWCSLAGTFKWNGYCVFFFFPLSLIFDFLSTVFWIWMHLRGRIKQRDLEWWQRKVQVSKAMPSGASGFYLKLDIGYANCAKAMPVLKSLQHWCCC